jgi:hypothetical protein
MAPLSPQQLLPRALHAGHLTMESPNGNPLYLVLHIRPDRAVSQTKKAAT